MNLQCLVGSGRARRSTVSIAFALVLTVHGLIHLLGFAKAFGLTELPQLAAPVSQLTGLAWLTDALLFIAAAVALFAWPRGWWMIGAAAVVLSMTLVAGAWSDARYGALVNAMASVGVVFGFLVSGPFSLRAEYERDVDRALSHMPPPGPDVTEADLAHLPDPIQRYLRNAGVVGQPRVWSFRVGMHGRIRSAQNAAWLPLKAEQYNTVIEPSRMFYLQSAMFGIPVLGYHRFVGSAATMRIRAGGLVPVVGASGDVMTESETVTLLNDMCLMAPATLVAPSVSWEPIDSRHARAAFSHAGHTIRAVIEVNDAGELVNFWSDDRSQISGASAKKMRWSTPVNGYKAYGPLQLAAGGEARWHDPEGEYPYIELAFDDITYNTSTRRG